MLETILLHFYLSVDDGGETEVVKDLRAVPPDCDGAELAEALVIKAVDLGKRSALLDRFISDT